MQALIPNIAPNIYDTWKFDFLIYNEKKLCINMCKLYKICVTFNKE